MENSVSGNPVSGNGVIHITTAIPYVNAAPHLGHAFELVLADAIARHHRSRGARVRLQSGSDDNALKNARAAEALGVPTAEFVRRNVEQFRSLAPALGVELDDYVSTGSDPRHTPAVAEIWRRAVARGDVDRRAYRGTYCVGCESFVLPSELDGDRCPVHGTVAECVEETNYFFALNRYQHAIEDAIGSGRLRIVPEERRNEALGFVRRGLRDFSISRSATRTRGWGIPVPGDGSQVVYVWFDALINYLSGLGFPSDGWTTPFFEPGARRIHVIGKEVLKFHAAYWPALLLSAGLDLPTDLVVHGHVTSNGTKLSKSACNAIDPIALVERWGSDAVRYALLRHVHSFKDTEFDVERLRGAYDSELAGQFGNLARRTLALAVRHAGGLVPPSTETTDDEAALRAAADTARREVWLGFDAFAVHDAAAAIWRFVAEANRYVDRTRPWALAHPDRSAPHRARHDARRLGTILHHLLESLRIIAVLVEPILPNAARRLLQQLGTATAGGTPEWGGVRPGARLSLDGVLFPRESAPDKPRQ